MNLSFIFKLITIFAEKRRGVQVSQAIDEYT